ncbi:hypothetical protein F511_09844 [Dorcoceras hygrometricum]|uniref:Uncharacterized protein n=1 Tax=Dorcoceras hygrometricum TaxID=472368 RepID=A0A2Z7CFW7_9LAMI|nr:hypothetical protein F511_09844 [Dorcoceras hygrometricum]
MEPAARDCCEKYVAAGEPAGGSDADSHVAIGRLSAEWSNAIIGVVDRRSCRIGIPPSCDGLTGLEYHGSMISPRWIFTEWV